MTAPAPVRVYKITNGIPELGMPSGDYLTIFEDRKENPYLLVRILTRRVAEMILASPGVLLTQGSPPRSLELLK